MCIKHDLHVQESTRYIKKIPTFWRTLMLEKKVSCFDFFSSTLKKKTNKKFPPYICLHCINDT